MVGDEGFEPPTSSV